MKEKIDRLTEIHDLFDAHLGENFAVAQRLLDIRIEANSIAEMARKRVSEDGEFAKLYADSIGEWVANIASIAEKALAKSVEVNKGKGLNR